MLTRYRFWAVYDNQVFDLSDYVASQAIDSSSFSFLDTDIVDLFQQQPGQDITKELNAVLDGLDTETREKNMDCISNIGFYGKPDFRKSARCQVQNIILLVISIILMVSIGVKCKSSFSSLTRFCSRQHVPSSLGRTTAVAEAHS